jgi:hypothetical protein
MYDNSRQVSVIARSVNNNAVLLPDRECKKDGDDENKNKNYRISA